MATTSLGALCTFGGLSRARSEADLVLVFHLYIALYRFKKKKIRAKTWVLSRAVRRPIFLFIWIFKILHLLLTYLVKFKIYYLIILS